MEAAVKVRGGKSIMGKLGRLLKVATVGRLMYRAMYGPAQGILENAQNRCPVDTGNLRESIHIVDGRARRRGLSVSATNLVTRESIRIEAAAFYAINVEYGTRDTPAQPFLRPAADEEKAQFIRDVTVFCVDIIVGIWTTPIGGFILSFPIEDIGDKAVEAYVNRREIWAKLRGEKAPAHIKVRDSFKGRVANATLARAQGARGATSREAFTARRLARARKRGGNA